MNWIMVFLNRGGPWHGDENPFVWHGEDASWAHDRGDNHWVCVTESRCHLHPLDNPGA